MRSHNRAKPAYYIESTNNSVGGLSRVKLTFDISRFIRKSKNGLSTFPDSNSVCKFLKYVLLLALELSHSIAQNLLLRSSILIALDELARKM